MTNNAEHFSLIEEKKQAYNQMYKMTEDISDLIQQRDKAYESIYNAHLETLKRLALAAEYKDDDTGTHIVRMSHFSSLIAKSLDMNNAFCETMLYASPMHDIGKIGVPDNILKKPGKLTVEEFDQMKKHPEYGHKILSGSEVPVLNMAAEIALSHHEKFDGSGYPYGLKGEVIPLTGRIVALADYFDALTMDRCYRKAFSDDTAFEMIDEGSGKHFDPVIVGAFYRVKDEIIDIRSEINSSQP